MESSIHRSRSTLSVFVALAVCIHSQLAAAVAQQASTGTIVEQRVDDASDDAQESASGVVQVAVGKLIFGQQLWVGFRFPNIPIPPDSCVSNAYIEFTAVRPDSLPTDLTILAEDSDNAVSFTATNGDISSRPKTTSSTSWANVQSWAFGQTYQTPDISGPVQEVLERLNWADGNAIVVLFRSDDLAGARVALSYEATPLSAALLHVEYSPCPECTVDAECDDSNPCTDDSCVAGFCENVNNTTTCDDGDACTTGDTCNGGTCVGGAPPDCDDGNVCTDDSCDPASGCLNTNNAAACDDGDACTTNDTCAGGVCAGGAPPDCDDGNVCTDDSCDPAMGCVNTNNTAACDDGDACTTNDTCAGGVCAGGAPPDCDDGNVCTDDSCDPASGCLNTNNTAACDDGDACTTNDTCAGGVCVGGAPPDCDDGNVCTDDSCDPASGCLNTNNTAACDDGDACTTGDTCTGGVCIGGAPPDCDDANECTDDSCDPATGCVNTNNTISCEDGLFCNGIEMCQSGICMPGMNPCPGMLCDESLDACADCLLDIDCDDSNPCTDDSCIDGLCSYTDNTVPCDDGQQCTGNDTCDMGICSGTPIPGCGKCVVDADCEDNNPCTDDECPAGLCVYTNNAVPCDDGDACTTGDTCAGGVCAGGAPPDCDDANECTDDSCDPATGCVNTNNSAACDDGDACTTGDTCAGGACVGGAPPDCDDANECTDDSCDPATGCVNTNNSAACDDGDACTTGDTCAGGACVGGAPPDCDDGNECTDDSCDPATGCVNTNNSAACDDGDACTTGDTCAGGVCIGGAPPDCDDGNECTDDSCDPATGCVNTNNSAACDDGDACTTGDTCAGGVCVGGGPPDCDDGNECTDDSCDPESGCVQTNNTISCEDGLFCNGSEVCGGGTCQPGSDPCAPLGCDETGDTCIPSPVITGIELFYAGHIDDEADLSREFLGTGSTATSSNVSSYDNGITGIRIRFSEIVDFATTPVAALGFEWTVGNGTVFESVADVTSNVSVTTDNGGGFTEMTIIIADDHVRRRWLRVHVFSSEVSFQGVSLDGESAGNPAILPSGDGNPGGDGLFHTGNLPGDVNGDLRTSLTDPGLIRDLVNPFVIVPVTSVYDVDKDGRILLTDVGLARAAVNPFFVLPQISP